MPTATGTKIIKPTHRSIKAYYETLKGYAGQAVSHETAVRSAFQTLLADAAKLRHWMLVPELASEGRGRARVAPDGTVRDEFLIPRGYWEAKDTADDLDAEIAKKIAKGYPLTNIIFEDTRTGVLYRNGNEALRVDLADKAQRTELLDAFLAYADRRTIFGTSSGFAGGGKGRRAECRAVLRLAFSIVLSNHWRAAVLHRRERLFHALASLFARPVLLWLAA